MREKIINSIIDMLYLIAGFGSLSLSIFYSIKLFLYNGVNTICSITFSLVYVLFLTLIFTHGIKLILISKEYKDKMVLFSNKKSVQYIIVKNKRIHNFLIGCLILLIWLFLVVYSIIATIGGQYDQLSKLEINREENNTDENQIPIIEEKIILLKNQSNLFQNEINMVEKRLNSVQDVEKSYQYKNTTKKNEDRLDELRNKLLENDNSIMNLKNQIMEIKIESKNIIEGSIYKYFQRITGISSLFIQFILSFFPSIVIDFFAPISFSLFLYRKRE